MHTDIQSQKSREEKAQHFLSNDKMVFALHKRVFILGFPTTLTL